jgi:hypothetical protein
MKKKLITLFVFVVSTASLFAQTQPTDTDGDGYYNISTLNHLRWVSENSASWSWNFELDNDIDASDTRNWNEGAGWSPIGNSAISFRGKFDGHYFEIQGLFISRGTKRIGLFGFTEEAEIKNLGIRDCDIEGFQYVSGIAGYSSSSIILRSFVTGTVIGYNEVGGIVGFNYPTSTIQECYSSCQVSGNKNVSGFVGNNSYGSAISNCFSTGIVDANESVGGFIGNNYSSSAEKCFSKCQVSGNIETGGLIGIDVYEIGLFTNSFWDISVSSIDVSAGGVGQPTSEMKQQSTYTNWDFETIWGIDENINSGYPYLLVFENSIELIRINETTVELKKRLPAQNPKFEIATSYTGFSNPTFSMGASVTGDSWDLASVTIDRNTLPVNTMLYVRYVDDNGVGEIHSFMLSESGTALIKIGD